MLCNNKQIDLFRHGLVHMANLLSLQIFYFFSFSLSLLFLFLTRPVVSSVFHTSSFSLLDMEEPTLESVLCNRTTDLFRDFVAFLQQTFCTENLYFWLAVQQYIEDCRQLGHTSAEDAPLLQHSLSSRVIVSNNKSFDFSVSDSGVLSPKENDTFGMLQENCLGIIRNHIRPNSPQEINIPCDMRQAILQRVNDGCFHPAIFAPASEAVVELMRANAFIPWMTDRPLRDRRTLPCSLSLPNHLNYLTSSSCSSVHSEPLSNPPPSPVKRHQLLLRRVKKSLGLIPKQHHQQQQNQQVSVSAPSTPRTSDESTRSVWPPFKKMQR